MHTVPRPLMSLNFRSLPTRLLLCILACGASVAPAAAANKYWVGASGTTNTPTSGTWQTTTPTAWSDGTIATANSGWSAGDTAFFGGTDGTYAITVGGAIGAGGIAFLNSGYTLSASSAQTISVPSVSGATVPQLRLGLGVTATIGTNVTAQNSVSTGLVIGTAGTNVSGTLNISGKVAQNSANTGGIDGYGTVVNVLPGGSLLGPTGSSSGGFVVGRSTGADCMVNVNGGTFGITSGNTAAMTIGNNGTGTVNVVSGAFTMSKNTGNGIVLGTVADVPGTLNLNGGLTTTPKISMGTAGTQSTLNFNGGALQANAANVAFVAGLTTANVRNGGAIIDSAGFAITISQPLLHSPLSGDNAIDGGLVKNGANALTLSGANTYNGPTAVNAGQLVTTTASTGGGAYTVANNATLEVQVGAPATSLAMSSLTLGSGGNVTNTLTLGANWNAATPVESITGALNLNGTVYINVSATSLAPDSYVLLSYGSLSGTGTLLAGTVPTIAGYTAVVQNDTVSKKIKLSYVIPTAPVRWAVGNGNWDTTSLNWQPVAGGAPTSYSELSDVTFDDTATGTSPITVTLAGARSPGNINVNGAKDYVLAGSSTLGGSGTLYKAGTATLILAATSTRGGGVDIEGGTVQVGNGGTTGSTGSGNITNNGALVFNRGDVLTVPGAISGFGSLTQNGPGTLSLVSTNSYTGPTLVTAGKLAIQTISTGAGTFTVADSATLEVSSPDSTSTLNISTLTLGTSGTLTNNFVLPTARSAAAPMINVAGNLNLNGTVRVNVSTPSLAEGAYVLLQYSGSLNGAGSFVAGSLPAGVWSLVHDPVNKQLKLVGLSAWYWDAGNTNNGAGIDPADGTWDTAAGNLVWNNGGLNAAWQNGINAALFGGTDGVYIITVGAAVTAPSIWFTNSGYTLSASNAQTVSLTSTAGASAPQLRLGAGTTATIGTNVTVQNSPATGLVIGTAGTNASGTLNISGKVLQNSANTGGIDGYGTVVNVLPGGSLLGPTGSSSGGYIIGRGVGANCTVNVNGGTFGITSGNTVAMTIGSNGTGTVNVVSGTFALSKNTGNGIVLGTAVDIPGILNLNGGLTTTPKISMGSGGTLSILNFNGGTLQANAANAAFVAGLTTANVRNGGAVIDDGGNAITIGQALLHSGMAGDNAVDGGLTKLGAGSLTLAGANTYTGPTTVSNGTLVLTPASTGQGALSVRDGATLEVQLAGTGTSLTNSSLTLGTAGAVTLNFTLGVESPTVPVIEDTGALNLNGPVTVNVTGYALSGTTYVLLKYGSLNGGGSFVAGSIPVVAGYTGTLVHNTNARQLQLVYTLTPDPIQWAVGNGNWDTTSRNWQPVGGGSLTTYSEFAPVTFDDSATGTSPITVTLTGDHIPGDINVNATKDYIFDGGFALNGSGALVKNSSGTLTLAANTTRAGGTTINAGTLQIGNGGGTGSLGGGPINNYGGSLVFNRSNSLVLNSPLNSYGPVVQKGTGATTLTATNNFYGDLTISSGMLTVVANASSLAAGNIMDNSILVVSNPADATVTGTIAGSGAFVKAGAGNLTLWGNNTYTGNTTNSGGALILATSSTPSDPGSVVTSGPLGTGTLVFNGANIGTPAGLGTLVIANPMLVQGTGNAVNANQTTPLVLNGSMRGTGSITEASGSTGGQFVSFGGDWSGFQGTFNYTGGAVHANNVNFTQTNSAAADVSQARFNLSGYGSTVNRTLSVGGAVGMTFAMGELSGTNPNPAPVVQPYTADSGTVTLQVGALNTSSSFNGFLQDNGTALLGLTKVGTGTLTLTVASSYTGPTIVSNGTLRVNGSLATSPLTVANGATLGGTGTLGGAVAVNSGGTLAPGAGSLGTLTINSNLVLNGNLAIELDKSAALSNDLCVVTGTLTNAGNGTVTITNLGPVLAVGDKFTLFNQPVLNGQALALSPAPGAGLGWTNRLAIDGSIAVIATLPSYPTNIVCQFAGSSVWLSWPATHLGYLLQAQTNALSIGLSTNWVDLPGTDKTTATNFPVNPANGTVFYRLRHP